MRELFWEYLEWANARVNEEFGVDFNIKAMLEDDMKNLHIFFPPDGHLLLAKEGPNVAGIVCLKKLRNDMGEIKRMYVRPEFRGKGLGRALIEALISEAKKYGYEKVGLDSARFMKKAHALYRSSGFEEIEPYVERSLKTILRIAAEERKS